MHAAEAPVGEHALPTGFARRNSAAVDRHMTDLPPSRTDHSLDLGNLLTETPSPPNPDLTPQGRMHSLLQAVLTIGGDLDLATVLRRLTEVAAGLTDARYAGLGVFDEDGTFSEFIPVGLSESEARQIADFPHGKGLLSAPLHRRSVLRLRDLREHPDFGGFPDGHPRMSSFLGAPMSDR